MGYKNLQECIRDLEKTKQLIRINTPHDPNLEVGTLQRRVFQNKGPALLFTHVKNTHHPMLANLFGTLERTRFLFRDALDDVKKLIDLKIDPVDFTKHIIKYWKLPFTASHLRPKKVSRGPILKNKTSIGKLPQLKSWPKDGGPYITLPQVYSELPSKPGWRFSNIGMYRIQLSGNDYIQDQEVGLHYQLHRGIGVHQAEAWRLKKPFKVNIFVGGAPAMTLAAVMPLPENLPEIAFAGAMAGHRIPMIHQKDSLPIYAEADFCITGEIIPNINKPEGWFGDHLGYYSLKHPMPVLRVENVYHRDGAIWPFTTVGRPPQEDTVFGAFIHELTGPVIPSVLPGVKAIHAVDATGVHPLLLAIGSERYTPYQKTIIPQEILTQANAILGQGQLSLTKYLVITNNQDNPDLNIHDIPAFLTHVLERINFERDLHFQTSTTIDTLDYSGTGFNRGSKLIIAAAGPKRRDLPKNIPNNSRMPPGYKNPRTILPGIIVIEGTEKHLESKIFCDFYQLTDSINQFPLIVLVDDSEFCSRSLDNFLWVTFTKSNPSHDIDGIGSFTQNKHWGCKGSLIIDARTKPHHAPVLQADPDVEKKVDALGTLGGPLKGFI